MTKALQAASTNYSIIVGQMKELERQQAIAESEVERLGLLLDRVRERVKLARDAVLEAAEKGRLADEEGPK